MKLTAFAFETIGISELGHVRKKNEDAFLIQEELGLFLLADGMGGGKAGRVAADLAIESFLFFSKEVFRGEKISTDQAKGLFVDGYQYINEQVFEKGQTDGDCEGMGTTFCALLLLENEAIISHIGDSRIYLYREDHLAQLTEDHTLLNEALYRSTSEDELPSKHILSRAIGPYPTVTPSIETCVFKGGDLFLICSDGLTNSLTDSEIKEIVAQDGGCSEMGNHLMQVALNNGGRDNVTFILVQIGDDQS